MLESLPGIDSRDLCVGWRGSGCSIATDLDAHRILIRKVDN
jgi:hypothetical protein